MTPLKTHTVTGLPESYQPVIQAIGDEVIVYDPIQAKAHHLTSRTAKVYQACEEGKWNRKELDKEFGPEAVLNTLLELNKAGLILWNPPKKLGRRRFLVAAASVPVLSTVVVPSPSAAASVTCSTTDGSTGCAGVMSGSGGGASGRGPSGGCNPCCGPSASLSCRTCNSDCSQCYCLAVYACSDDGSAFSICSSTTNPKDICQTGSTDYLFSLTCSTLGTAGNPARALSCTTARAQTGGFLYACCACP